MRFFTVRWDCYTSRRAQQLYEIIAYNPHQCWLCVFIWQTKAFKASMNAWRKNVLFFSRASGFHSMLFSHHSEKLNVFIAPRSTHIWLREMWDRWFRVINIIPSRFFIVFFLFAIRCWKVFHPVGTSSFILLSCYNKKFLGIFRVVYLVPFSSTLSKSSTLSISSAIRCCEKEERFIQQNRCESN